MNRNTLLPYLSFIIIAITIPLGISEIIFINQLGHLPVSLSLITIFAIGTVLVIGLPTIKLRPISFNRISLKAVRLNTWPMTTALLQNRTAISVEFAIFTLWLVMYSVPTICVAWNALIIFGTATSVWNLSTKPPGQGNKNV